MRNYVTVADKAYLPRLKVLHASMLRHCQPFTLHVLPWDDDVFAWAMMTPSVQHHLSMARWWQTCDLPGLPRTLHERMWSARSDLTATLLDRSDVNECPPVDSVCQLDADLMFFSSPEQAFADVERAGATAGVMPHYFASAADGLPGITEETHLKYGRYNSGFVFVRDAALARRWADQTREWCYFRLEDGKFADQPYLNDFPTFGAVEFPPWVAPGPWTSKVYAGENYDMDSHVGFANEDLIAWHFSSLKMNPDGTVVQYANAEYALSEETIRSVYLPYVAELREAMK